MEYKNLKTGQTGPIAQSASLYAVRCESRRYATHVGSDGNFYCFYGTAAVFDGHQWLPLNR